MSTNFVTQVAIDRFRLPFLPDVRVYVIVIIVIIDIVYTRGSTVVLTEARKALESGLKLLTNSKKSR